MKTIRTIRFICTCKKCGYTFKSANESTKFCDKHRLTGRPKNYKPKPEIERECRFCGQMFTGRPVPVNKGIFCSHECQKKSRLKKAREKRMANGAIPRPIREKKIVVQKPVKIEPLRKMDKAVTESKPLILTAPTVYKTVRVNAKTVIEFRTKERYEKYIKDNKAV